MQKFADSIHQAFAKIDASDPKMRQKVYENIWLIQEKSLAAQNSAEPDKQQRRQQLTQLLKTVETQYRAAAQPNAQAAAPATAIVTAPARNPVSYPLQTGHAPAAAQNLPAAPAVEAPQRHAAPPQNRRSAKNQPQTAVSAPHESRQTADHSLRAENRHSAEEASLYYLEREVNRKVRRKPEEDFRPSLLRRIKLGTYCISLLSLFVAVFVAWSFYNSFGPASARQKQQALSTGPMQHNTYGKNGWAEVFNPSDISGLTVKGAASADLHNDPDANFIRIIAQNADDAAILQVGQGALLPLRGKTATFMLLARDADASSTVNNVGKLSVAADFGSGVAARYLFELSPTLKPILFRLAIPQHLNQPVTFRLGSDSAAKQSQVDIFSLLVRESDDSGH